MDTFVFSWFTQAHTYGYKYLFRIKEKCFGKMVKRGYGLNRENMAKGQGV